MPAGADPGPGLRLAGRSTHAAVRHRATAGHGDAGQAPDRGRYPAARRRWWHLPLQLAGGRHCRALLDRRDGAAVRRADDPGRLIRVRPVPCGAFASAACGSIADGGDSPINSGRPLAFASSIAGAGTRGWKWAQA
ncbi:conserved protein of unknown function [Ectopseudomonas oleovorans]|uniref:Uncharacterized protein n=1 Tax=Ectopseudomonas oleovorans TaxID=301 RepID=A0A653B097_ECTOL|nr:conserved protein of unknown function [Pseudomonas oleovorans]